MKKTLIALFMAVLAISCSTGNKITSAQALAGEWYITEIEGTPVKMVEDTERPFLGFDLEKKLVYGNSGCNRLTGALKTEDKTGKIDFGSMASTRMMCHNMETEQKVLEAMPKVTSFKTSGKGLLKLCNKDGKTVMLLVRK